MTAELQPTDMSGWAPVTKHYRTSDGVNLAVEACADELPEGAEVFVNEVLAVENIDPASTNYLARPTYIFACDENGAATDLTPLHEFPVGTTHENALEQAGY